MCYSQELMVRVLLLSEAEGRIRQTIRLDFFGTGIAKKKKAKSHFYTEPLVLHFSSYTLTSQGVLVD